MIRGSDTGYLLMPGWIALNKKGKQVYSITPSLEKPEPNKKTHAKTLSRKVIAKLFIVSVCVIFASLRLCVRYFSPIVPEIQLLVSDKLFSTIFWQKIIYFFGSGLSRLGIEYQKNNLRNRRFFLLIRFIV